MSDGHRLVQAMRRAGETPQNEVVDIVVGEVTSISPLKVKIETRELTEAFLIVGALCKETKVGADSMTKYQHNHSVPAASTGSASPGPHTHTIDARNTGSATLPPSNFTITLWRGLKVGDRVLMLKVGKGQKYYIIQREEGVTPT